VGGEFFLWHLDMRQVFGLVKISKRLFVIEQFPFIMSDF
jgi:hypothetical protein